MQSQVSLNRQVMPQPVLYILRVNPRAPEGSGNSSDRQVYHDGPQPVLYAVLVNQPAPEGFSNSFDRQVHDDGPGAAWYAMVEAVRHGGNGIADVKTGRETACGNAATACSG